MISTNEQLTTVSTLSLLSNPLLSLQKKDIVIFFVEDAFSKIDVSNVREMAEITQNATIHLLSLWL